MSDVYKKDFAHYYDLMYQWKEYATEAITIHQTIAQYKQTEGNDLLEVACGTGNYFPHLGAHYQLTGLDLSEGMLAVAQRKFPNIPLHHADMTNFDLGKQFDVIICLFSSIAYLQTLEKLEQALRCFYNHLKPGGVALVETFVDPDRWKGDRPHSTLNMQEGETRLTRMSHSYRKGDLSFVDMHTIVTTPVGIQHFQEHHVLALWQPTDVTAVFQKVGFTVERLPGLLMTDRSCFVGVREH